MLLLLYFHYFTFINREIFISLFLALFLRTRTYLFTQLALSTFYQRKSQMRQCDDASALAHHASQAYELTPAATASKGKRTWMCA